MTRTILSAVVGGVLALAFLLGLALSSGLAGSFVNNNF